MKITICIGSSCHLKGSRQIIEQFQQSVEEKGLKDTVDLCGAFCMKNCVNGVSVMVGSELFSVTPENAESFFKAEVLKRVKN